MLTAHPLVAVPHEAAFLRRVFQIIHARGKTRDLNLAWNEIRKDHSFRRWRLDEEAVHEALAEYPPASYPDLIRTLFAAFAASRGKSLSADKTPRNTLIFRLLGDMFPGSHFVHVLRDPREVAMSLAVQHWSTGGIARAAMTWRFHVSHAKVAAAELGDRLLEVRYEDLVTRPERELEALCALGGIPFDPAMLDYPDSRDVLVEAQHAWARRPPRPGLRRWREEMTRDDISLVELVAGDLMDRLGYARMVERPTRRATLEWSRFRARGRFARRVAKRSAVSLPPLPVRLPSPSGPFRPIGLAQEEPTPRAMAGTVLNDDLEP
jgi:hypothetical protein